MKGDSEVEALRAAIDAVDDRLLALIGERMALVRAIGRVKAAQGPLRPDPAREAAIVARLAGGAVDGETVAAVWGALFAASHRVQGGDVDGGPRG